MTPGYSIASYFLRRTSLLSENYHFAVMPDVHSISPNVGTYSGQRITISGRGFSTNNSVIQVDVNGTGCDVVSSTLDQIVCDLREKNISDSSELSTSSGSPINRYFSGRGLKYERYGISGLGNKTPAGLKTAIQTSSGEISLI